MPRKSTTQAPVQAAGTTPATGVQYRCQVTEAGAGKTYGESRHKKGKNAIVILGEAEADAAEKAGWVKKAGIA